MPDFQGQSIPDGRTLICKGVLPIELGFDSGDTKDASVTWIKYNEILWLPEKSSFLQHFAHIVASKGNTEVNLQVDSCNSQYVTEPVNRQESLQLQ